MGSETEQTAVQTFSVDERTYAVHVNKKAPFTGRVYLLSEYAIFDNDKGTIERGWSYAVVIDKMILDDPDNANPIFTFDFPVRGEATIQFSQVQFYIREVDQMMRLWQQIDTYLKARLNG